MKKVLIVGSGPEASKLNTLASHFQANALTVVVINNAWRACPPSVWNYHIHPDDFPFDKRPTSIGQHQKVVNSTEYVPANNQFGGIVYCGGTMAFSAAYWVLAVLKPSVIGFLGCDMVYPKQGKTHFYGCGSPDPLRNDPTLQSLPAKSARFGAIAIRSGSSVFNLSGQESVLPYKRIALELFVGGGFDLKPQACTRRLGPKIAKLRNYEDQLGYFFPDGRYFETKFSNQCWDDLKQVDGEWMNIWNNCIL